MKQVLSIILLIFCCLSYTSAQSAADSITVKKVFGGYQFRQAGKLLSLNQLSKVLKTNEEAWDQYKSAQTNYALALVFSGAGGFLIGRPIGTAIAGGEPNWALAGIGAGLVIVAIPIAAGYNTKAKQAVQTYNSGLQKTSSFWDRNQLKLTLTGNGIGFALKF